MGERNGDWKATVENRMEDLCECTVITPELVTSLTQDKLISSSEDHFLRNSNNSNHEQAQKLYGIISKRWNNQEFEKFKAALTKSGNSRAFEILRIGVQQPASGELSTLHGARPVSASIVKVDEVAKILMERDTNESLARDILGDRSKFLSALKIPPHQMLTKIDNCNRGIITFRNLLPSILSAWYTANGNDATVGVLVQALLDIEMKGLADVLEEHFQRNSRVQD